MYGIPYRIISLKWQKSFITYDFKNAIIFYIEIENRRGITSAHKMQTSKIKILLQRKMDLLFMNILSHTLLQKTSKRKSFSVPSTTRYQSSLVHEIPPCVVSFMSSKNLRLYIYWSFVHLSSLKYNFVPKSFTNWTNAVANLSCKQ